MEQRRTRATLGKSSLVCVVCDGKAHGNHFDAVTCESCKTFFRRNAHFSLDELKCFDNGQCDITGERRRYCKKCRLQKCFHAGMRKEWILTDRERREKREKIEENRRRRIINETMLIFRQKRHENFCVTAAESGSIWTEVEKSKINEIEDSYRKSMESNSLNDTVKHPLIQPIENYREFFSMPIYISSIRLISFFKASEIFQTLDENERVLLVQSNTLTIVFLHSLLIYHSEENIYYQPNTNDPLFLRSDWLKIFDENLKTKLKSLGNNFLTLVHSDRTIVKLVFLLILFSNENVDTPKLIEPQFSLKIFHRQNFYNDLLFKYCLDRYGLVKTSRIYLKYVTKIIEIRRLVDDLRSFIDRSVDKSQLPSLIQTLI